jgi:hypothetical protein
VTKPETVPAAELERMMKLQDVILKAMAKRITWMAAAEMAGVSDRTMRRMKERYETFGYDGLFDQRRGKRSIHRIALETAERVLAGMLLHIDGSKHRWFQDDRYYDLLVILDDAASEIY